MKIKNIRAREILDSNGYPTISTEIEVWSGEIGKAEVPSGTSTGKTEVVEMRDQDPERYNGKGVLNAVETINTKLKDLLVDKEFTSQKEFDQMLIEADGTEFKEKLGGNTILSCSMAFARAVTEAFGLELYEYLAMTYWDKQYDNKNFKLPTPQILVMEGAKHGNWATDIQEYMLVPNMETFENFAEALRASTEVFHSIHEILDSKQYSVGLGLEGGYAPKELKSNEEAFEIILEAIKKAGFEINTHFTLALDLASSEFFNEDKNVYHLKREDEILSRDELIALQENWVNKYPIKSIEDPLYEDDWEGWSLYTQKLGEKIMVVGDDLITTNTKRIKKALENKSINSVLVKLNQIGTVSETLDAIRTTVENNLKAIVSHRSGETNDDFIADLVIATPAQLCKFGAPSRGERIVKYNRLLEIEQRLQR
ncbi:MAG: phosphopyruvate hydratase [Candidatus Dojkabacteria bacterium]